MFESLKYLFEYEKEIHHPIRTFSEKILVAS